MHIQGNAFELLLYSALREWLFVIEWCFMWSETVWHSGITQPFRIKPIDIRHIYRFIYFGILEHIKMYMSMIQPKTTGVKMEALPPGTGLQLVSY